jgi:hypothetical protein
MSAQYLVSGGGRLIPPTQFGQGKRTSLPPAPLLQDGDVASAITAKPLFAFFVVREAVREVVERAEPMALTSADAQLSTVGVAEPEVVRARRP